MIPRNLSGDSLSHSAWNDLDSGAPTISAFAELCRQALITPPDDVDPDQLVDGLLPEAVAILVACGKRGTVDIRACKDDFDSVQRFLAVCVEPEPDRRILFLQKDKPRQTVAFLEGFSQLCRMGLMLHHLGRDFSFSKSGFSLSKRVAADHSEKVKKLVGFGVELDEFSTEN